MWTLLLVLVLGMPRQGEIFYYSRNWGEWNCPGAQKCGIAARQGLSIPSGWTAIAVPECAELGRMGFLQIGSSPPFRVIVADCAATADRQRILDQGIIAETPYSIAERHQFLEQGRTQARLWLLPPRTSRATVLPPRPSRPPSLAPLFLRPWQRPRAQ